jgi:hypothetical protein
MTSILALDIIVSYVRKEKTTLHVVTGRKARRKLIVWATGKGLRSSFM